MSLNTKKCLSFNREIQSKARFCPFCAGNQLQLFFEIEKDYMRENNIKDINQLGIDLMLKDQMQLTSLYMKLTQSLYENIINESKIKLKEFKDWLEQVDSDFESNSDDEDDISDYIPVSNEKLLNNLREYVNLYNRIISLFQFINRCSDACLGIKYDFIEEFSPISCKLIKNEINNNEEYSDQDFLSSMYEEINKKHEIIIDASDKLNQIVLDLTLFENPDA